MLGNISAVATLILFVIYFIGRVITIIVEKDVCKDRICIEYSEKVHEKYEIVGQRTTERRGGSDCPATVVLTSMQGIWDVRLIEIAYDEERNENKKLNRSVKLCDFLNVGCSYAVNTFVPESIPWYRIEYRTQDMKKVRLDIVDNLDNGIIQGDIQQRHTFKSVMYYLFR